MVDDRPEIEDESSITSSQSEEIMDCTSAIVDRLSEDEEERSDDGTDEKGSLTGEGGNECVQLSLTLTKSDEGVKHLIAQQQAAVRLKDWRRKAEKGKDGFSVEGDVIIHIKASPLGKKWT